MGWDTGPHSKPDLPACMALSHPPTLTHVGAWAPHPRLHKAASTSPAASHPEKRASW